MANALQKYFGFVGYPHTFHMDNGKEYIAKTVVNLLKDNNPPCFVVIGRLRTPRDQGSVESMNKMVQQIIKSISSKHHQAGLEDNLTNFFDQISGCCNSHSSKKKHSVSNYKAVFGQKYHLPLKC